MQRIRDKKPCTLKQNPPSSAGPISMSSSVALSRLDRILIVAPHPDDESLAAGGLIQRAVALGAAVRVLFVTNGDSNPWPQRFLEHRWKIDATDCARWGALRRAEAESALVRLGAPDTGIFFGFPDQGITRLLMTADDSLVSALAAQIESWKPTIFLLPSGADRHPDHNAAWVQAQIALSRTHSSAPIRCLEYLVHYREWNVPPVAAKLSLLDDEVKSKRAAILCHGTQVALSRGRFLGYARANEEFFALASPRPKPAILGRCTRRTLRLSVNIGVRAIFSILTRGCMLALALEDCSHQSRRWTLRLPLVSGKVFVYDALTGKRICRAIVRIRAGCAEIAIPIAAVQPLKHVFVKLKCRALISDTSGWNEIALPAAPSVGSSVHSR